MAALLVISVKPKSVGRVYTSENVLKSLCFVVKNGVIIETKGT